MIYFLDEEPEKGQKWVELVQNYIIQLEKFEKNYVKPPKDSQFSFDTLMEYYNKREKVEYDLVDPVVDSNLLKSIGMSIFIDLSDRISFFYIINLCFFNYICKLNFVHTV